MHINPGDKVYYEGEVWEVLWTIPPDTESNRLRLARMIDDDHETMIEARIYEVQLMEHAK